MAEKDQDGYLEKMFREFMKDMIRKGIFSPFEPGEATGKKSTTIDDLFEKFMEQKEKFTRIWEEEAGKSEEKSKPPKEAISTDEPLEVVYLRAKVDQLKRQIEDKDEIIGLQRQEIKRLKKLTGDEG